MAPRKFNFNVVGMSFHPGSLDALRATKIGDTVHLKRDLANKFDVNAIGCYADEACEQFIGWVPRHASKLIAPILDGGAPATASRVSGGAGVCIDCGPEDETP